MFLVAILFLVLNFKILKFFPKSHFNYLYFGVTYAKIRLRSDFREFFKVTHLKNRYLGLPASGDIFFILFGVFWAYIQIFMILRRLEQFFGGMKFWYFRILVAISSLTFPGSSNTFYIKFGSFWLDYISFEIFAT